MGACVLWHGWGWRRHLPGVQFSYRCTESAILDRMMVGLEVGNLERMSHIHKILYRSSRLGQILGHAILTSAKLTWTWQHTLECYKLLINSSLACVICSTTGPLPLLKQVLHRVPTSGFSFNFCSIAEGIKASQEALLAHLKLKVKFALEQAMKAQRGSRCVALLFLQPRC